METRLSIKHRTFLWYLRHEISLVQKSSTFSTALIPVVSFSCIFLGSFEEVFAKVFCAMNQTNRLRGELKQISFSICHKKQRSRLYTECLCEREKKTHWQWHNQIKIHLDLHIYLLQNMQIYSNISVSFTLYIRVYKAKNLFWQTQCSSVISELCVCIMAIVTFFFFLAQIVLLNKIVKKKNSLF